VVTAVAIQLPAVYFARRSVREAVVSGAAVALAMTLAVPALVIGLGTMYFIAGLSVSSAG
jgi:hypothetical protein